MQPLSMDNEDAPNTVAPASLECHPQPVGGLILCQTVEIECGTMASRSLPASLSMAADSDT